MNVVNTVRLSYIKSVYYFEKKSTAVALCQNDNEITTYKVT